jgi:hypothetical protein
MICFNNARHTFRWTVLVIVTTVAGAAFSQSLTAQSDPLIGVWKLNVAKSKYSPGPAPQSSTMHYEAEGAGFKDTVTGIDAQGRPTTSVFTMIYDGEFRPTRGVTGYDASAFTRIDDYTILYVRTLYGKVVASGTRVMSRDGKTLTFTGIGLNANGKRYDNVVVMEKQ